LGISCRLGLDKIKERGRDNEMNLTLVYGAISARCQMVMRRIILTSSIPSLDATSWTSGTPVLIQRVGKPAFKYAAPLEATRCPN
jgi:hypothetical protein